MEKTLHTGDRVIVNRLTVTSSQLKNQEYTPNRGDIIVFKNPQFIVGGESEYLVKRVIAFAGERVTVNDGVLKVYNDKHKDGYVPDKLFKNGTPQQPTSGDVDTTVPTGMLFVSGDNRIDNHSYDSRLGLGFIPLYDVVGPVGMRIWPINSVKTF